MDHYQSIALSLVSVGSGREPDKDICLAMGGGKVFKEDTQESRTILLLFVRRGEGLPLFSGSL